MMDLMGLYRLAEDNDIAVDCFELKKREALSVMDSDGTCYIAIDPFKLASELDEKMKLGHELGHSVTGSFYNEYATCDVRRKHKIVQTSGQSMNLFRSKNWTKPLLTDIQRCGT